MSAARLKYGTIAAGLVLGALLLIASTQTWFVLVLAESGPLPVDGATVVPAQGALALAGLALFAVIGLAGPFFRAVLGMLGVPIGSLVIWLALLAISNPVAASAEAIADATGLVGEESVEELARLDSSTPWPWISVVLGLLFAALSIAVVITQRRWPGPTRKYQAVRFADEPGGDSTIADWDSLSAGSDPTSLQDPGR